MCATPASSWLSKHFTSACEYGGREAASVLKSWSRYSITMYTLSNPAPTTISRMPTMFGWDSPISTFASRSAVMGNPSPPPVSIFTFFSAYRTSVAVSTAENTTPYVPSSIRPRGR